MADNGFAPSATKHFWTRALNPSKYGRNKALEHLSNLSSKKARQVLRAFSSFWLKNYLVSLLGEAVNSFGFAIGRAVRLTSVGAPAAAP